MSPLQHLSPYSSITEKIISWFQENHEIFPWREKNDPYAIWVSEVMLQQTTVKTVIPYFKKFMMRFPSVQDLAAASLDEVLTYWQGLGYYRRAHQLHRAAQVIVETYHSHFPTNIKDIRKLPGIGDYTASAVSAIAYLKPHVPVDGNVYRVFSRVFALEHTVKELSKSVLPHTRVFEEILAKKGLSPSYFAQGLMDVGREICTSRKPRCGVCPIREYCVAYVKGNQENLPQKDVKKPIPLLYATCWVYRQGDEILLQKRLKKGLLSGLWQFPMTDIENTQPFLNPSTYMTKIYHVFSHFKLIVAIHKGEKNAPEGTWVNVHHVQNYALPTLMKKVLAASAHFELHLSEKS